MCQLQLSYVVMGLNSPMSPYFVKLVEAEEVVGGACEICLHHHKTYTVWVLIMQSPSNHIIIN